MIVLIAVAVVFVEGLLLVEDAALLGALPLHELVVHGALLPRHLLLLAFELEDQGFPLLLLLLLLGLRGRRCDGGVF